MWSFGVLVNLAWASLPVVGSIALWRARLLMAAIQPALDHNVHQLDGVDYRQVRSSMLMAVFAVVVVEQR